MVLLMHTQGAQAKKRSKADSKNKGFEAASAMVRMIECLT